MAQNGSCVCGQDCAGLNLLFRVGSEAYVGDEVLLNLCWQGDQAKEQGQVELRGIGSMIYTRPIFIQTYGGDEKEDGDGLRGPCHFGCVFVSLF